MKNRGDRLFIKAQIRKRLVEKAIREYIALVRTKEEQSNTGYTSLGRVLRNEGKSRKRLYACGTSFCDWCIGNLTRKNRRRDAAMTADFATWLAEGNAVSKP